MSRECEDITLQSITFCIVVVFIFTICVILMNFKRFSHFVLCSLFIKHVKCFVSLTSVFQFIFCTIVIKVELSSRIIPACMTMCVPYTILS